MKRTTTLLTALLTMLLGASAVQAGPSLFFDQLFGSAVTLSGVQDQNNAKGRDYWHENQQPQDGTGDGVYSGSGGPHEKQTDGRPGTPVQHGGHH